MSAFDLNDAAPQSGFDDLIPNGAIVLVEGRLRRGGATVDKFDHPEDQGAFKASQSSDVVMADWEFTVQAGKYARRKIWQTMVVEGGQVNEKGESKGWVITKSTLRAMVDSALGLNPKDESDAAKQKRNIPYFTALEYYNNRGDNSGIVFVAKIGVEKGQNGYPDRNKITSVVTPDKKEWQTVIQGGEILPQSAGGFGPAGFGAAPGFGQAPAAAPTAAPGFAPQGGFVAQPNAAPASAPVAAPAQPAPVAPGFVPAGPVAGAQTAGPAAMPAWAR